MFENIPRHKDGSHMSKNLNFSQALEAVKQGYKLYRANWKEGTYIKLSDGLIKAYNNKGEIWVFNADNDDMFSEYWFIV